MIIAVDFDGILCENQFPKIGSPNYEMISLIRQLIDNGHEVVLWTTRNGEELTEAVDWCRDYGLHFCNINGPAPSNSKEYENVYEHPSRKIYADVYIDDHNIDFIMAVDKKNYNYAINYTQKLITEVKRWANMEN